MMKQKEYPFSNCHGGRKWRSAVVGHRVQAKSDSDNQRWDKDVLCMEMEWAGVKE